MKTLARWSLWILLPVLFYGLGMVLSAIGSPTGPVVIARTGLWSSLGRYRLLAPTALAPGPDGSLLISDRDACRVYMFDTNGRLIAAAGGPGHGPGRFRQPFGVAWDGRRIYVADTGNNRIQVFDRHLHYGSTLTPGVPGPAGVVSDGRGGLWVTPGELSGGRWPMLHLNADGKIAGSAGPSIDGLPSLDDRGRIRIADRQASDDPVRSFDINGRQRDAFTARLSTVEEVAVHDGRVVAGDRGQATLRVFDARGNPTGAAPRDALRMPDGYARGPYGVAFDGQGDLWACFLDAGVVARYRLVKH